MLLIERAEGDAVAAAVAAAAEGPGEALIGVEIRRLGGAGRPVAAGVPGVRDRGRRGRGRLRRRRRREPGPGGRDGRRASTAVRVGGARRGAAGYGLPEPGGEADAVAAVFPR